MTITTVSKENCARNRYRCWSSWTIPGEIWDFLEFHSVDRL